MAENIPDRPKETAKRSFDVLNPDIQVPRLWGTDEEYGIEYPEGYEFEKEQPPRVNAQGSAGGYSGSFEELPRAMAMLRGEFDESPELKALIKERKELEARQDAEIEEFNERWDMDTLKKNYENAIKINHNEIIENLYYEMPEAEFKYPGEDEDVLLDSNLDYFNQIKRYKKFDIRTKGEKPW